jgi:hypothetical protein
MDLKERLNNLIDKILSLREDYNNLVANMKDLKETIKILLDKLEMVNKN